MPPWKSSSLFTQIHCFYFVDYRLRLNVTAQTATITCSSSSSAYFWRLSSFSVPSRSSLNRWASCLAAFISSLSFCSRFTFSTSTVRCSSWAICNLRKKDQRSCSIFSQWLLTKPKQMKPCWSYCYFLWTMEMCLGLSNPGQNFCCRLLAV